MPMSKEEMLKLFKDLEAQKVANEVEEAWELFHEMDMVENTVHLKAIEENNTDHFA